MRVRKHSIRLRRARSGTTIVRQPGHERDNSHFAGAGCAPLRVQLMPVRCGAQGMGTGYRVACCTSLRRQVRSDGSVFFAGVRISGESCAKIQDVAAVMMPTHRKVA